MGTVSTACQTFQATLRRVWANGSTYAEMVPFLGVTKDQIIRLRGVLKLPLRLDRSQRKKGPRHSDPSPQQIARMCAEIREKHLEQRQAEPPDRSYRTREELVRFRIEQSRELGADPLEQLLDSMYD